MNLRAMLPLALAGVLFAIPAGAQQLDVVFEGNGDPSAPMPPLPPPPHPGPGAMIGGAMMVALPPPAYGIPPRVVEKLGLSKELVQKIQDLTFEANGQLINLEADVKRAQLELDRLLHSGNPSENAVMQQVEAVGRAETAVRKNRIGLMLQIKRMLGPDNWQKLEAEMSEVRREVRILRQPPGFGEGGARSSEPRK
jgi:Spy/CpxP family protein refolding chaperone